MHNDVPTTCFGRFLTGHHQVGIQCQRNYIIIIIIIASLHSTAEHRASTRILHFTLFLASVLISAQVLLTPLASSSTVLRHVFLGLPLPCLPCRFCSRACLAMTSGDFLRVWPSHPYLRFLIGKSILGCFVCFLSYSGCFNKE